MKEEAPEKPKMIEYPDPELKLDLLSQASEIKLKRRIMFQKKFLRHFQGLNITIQRFLFNPTKPIYAHPHKHIQGAMTKNFKFQERLMI